MREAGAADQSWRRLVLTGIGALMNPVYRGFRRQFGQRSRVFYRLLFRQSTRQTLRSQRTPQSRNPIDPDLAAGSFDKTEHYLALTSAPGRDHRTLTLGHVGELLVRLPRLPLRWPAPAHQNHSFSMSSSDNPGAARSTPSARRRSRAASSRLTAPRNVATAITSTTGDIITQFWHKSS